MAALAYNIPATGIVRYNGFTFPPFITARIQGVPTYNSAETAVKYITYTLTIETVITYIARPSGVAALDSANVGIIDGTGTDAASRSDVGMTVDDLRKRLQKRGQELVFTRQGFGEMFINRASSTTVTASTAYNAVTDAKDVKMGPKPRLLVLEPLGANQAWRVVWTCEFTIPDCSQALYQSALAESTFESHFSVNEEGMTTRTIRGTLEIAATLSSDNKILDTVDGYIYRFLPQVPLGFHRETTRNISRDKRTCDFTIQDTEIASDNPLFPYMVKLNLQHTISAPFGFIQWSSTISGTVRWRAGVSPFLAFLAVTLFIKNRTDYAKNSVGTVVDPGTKAEVTLTGKVLPVSLSITENYFDRELSINYNYTVWAPPSTLFAATGLFQPFPGLTWENWHQSLAEIPGIQSPTGFAGMRDYGYLDENQMVGLCSDFSQVPGFPNNLVNKAFNVSGSYIFQPTCQDFTAESSWIASPPVTISQQSETRLAPQHPRTGTSSGETTPNDPVPGPSASNDNYQEFQSPTVTATQKPTYQQLGHNRYIIKIEGYAARLCQAPRVPTFTYLGNVKLVPLDSDQTSEAITFAGLPLYRLWWWKTYTYDTYVPGDLRTLLVPGSDASSGDRGG